MWGPSDGSRVGDFVVPSEHDVRQRAVICRDCWFFQEMSCALANPTDGVCANKRPVQGRRTSSARAVTQQARLVPLASGHAIAALAEERSSSVASPVTQQATPFAADAPEATFSLAQLRQAPVAAPAPVDRVAPVQQVRSTPPSFREIRSGRAAASSRAPVAEVRIPLAELDDPSLFRPSTVDGATGGVQHALPGMDQLVERVRQRTAARLSRASAITNA